MPIYWMASLFRLCAWVKGVVNYSLAFFSISSFQRPEFSNILYKSGSEEVCLDNKES